MRRVRRFWSTVLGLITLADVMGVVGFWLYKGTIRRTASVGIMLVALFVLGQKNENIGISWQSAVSGTGLILILSCLGGMALMSISGSVSKGVLMLGEAKGSNMIEDMKKARAAQHCDRLWARVYRYEQPRFPQAQRDAERDAVDALRPRVERACLPHACLGPEAGDLDDLESRLAELGTTHEGFRLLFDYCCQAPLPRSALRFDFRHDLSLVKDWYDGAPFHPSDNQLVEHYHGSENLREARRRAPGGWWHELDQRRVRTLQRIWFRVITRAIQLRVTSACARLDRAHPTYHFSPDLFLWPCPRTYRSLRERLGASVVEQVVALRKRIFHRVLHSELDLARRLMHRAIYPNFQAATHLRRRFDPQYVTGELAEDCAGDLRSYDRALAKEGLEAGFEAGDAHERHIARTRAEQAKLEAWLGQHREVAEPGDFLGRRACAVAVHTNQHGVADLLMGRPVRSRRAADAPATVEDILRAAVREKEDLRRLLLAVRLHHEMTRIELEDYEEYLARILA